MPTTGRRTATKLLRLHPDELARITARAKACGLKSARFIRETALGATPKARRHADIDRVLRALARLGRQLEQAARRVQSSGDAELGQQVATVLDSHRALAAQLVALRGRHGPPLSATTPQNAAASGGSVPRRSPRSGRAEPSGDQLTIEFGPAASSPAAARLQAAVDQ